MILVIGCGSLPYALTETTLIYMSEIKWPVLSLSIEGSGLPNNISVGFRVGDTIGFTQLKKGEEKIRQRLYSDGFLWAEVMVDTSIDAFGIRIKYRVNRHEQAKIGGWKLIGNDSFDEMQLLSILPSKGKGFNNAILTQVENKLLGIYASAGFPFAEVRLIGITESAGQVYSSFNINGGPRVKISFITFAEVKEQSEGYRSLLVRHSGFRKGVYYTPTQVKIWKRNLEKGGWISVDSQEIVMRQSQYGMRFWVSESISGEIFGVIGYMPEKQRLMGQIQVELFNLFHSGRRLRGKWYSASDETNYQLEYIEPWIFKTPLSLSAAVEHNVFDTSFAQVIFSLTGKFVKEVAEFSIGAKFDRTIRRNSRNRLLARTGFVFDSRDRQLNPQQGINFRFETSAGEQYIQNGGSGVIAWVETDIAPVVSILKQLVLVNNFSLRGVFSETLFDKLDLFSVGGTENVRGYQENSFSSNRLGWWNCELRYHFSGDSRLHIFFDNGIFSQYGAKVWSWISGCGVGGRFLTRLGIVGIDCAIPLAMSLPRVKIHLSLQTKF